MLHNRGGRYEALKRQSLVRESYATEQNEKAGLGCLAAVCLYWRAGLSFYINRLTA
jgi:hypothetical protein